MGFFDKVKEQAEKAKVQAQDLKGKVGEKVDEVQGKRKADELLDDLGRLSYAERTGRPLPGADSEMERLVVELKALEDDGVAILPAAPSGGAPPKASEAPEPADEYEVPDASEAPAPTAAPASGPPGPPPPLPETPA